RCIRPSGLQLKGRVRRTTVRDSDHLKTMCFKNLLRKETVTHAENVCIAVGSRVDTVHDNFSAGIKTNFPAAESKPFKLRPSDFRGRLGRRHAVCEWMAGPGHQGTHRYHVTDCGSPQGHPEVPRSAEADAGRR